MGILSFLVISTFQQQQQKQKRRANFSGKYAPPQEKRKQCGEKARIEQYEAKDKLRARWAWKPLTYRKELLILGFRTSDSAHNQSNYTIVA